MPIPTMDDVIKGFYQSLPAMLLLLVLGITMIIIFVRIVRITVKDTVDRVEKKMDSILQGQSQIDFVVKNFQSYQEVVNILNQQDSIYAIYDQDLENTIGLFNQNFSNGSSFEKAMRDADSFRVRLTDILSKRGDVPYKENHLILIEVLHEKLSRLIDSLTTMKDYAVKPKLISSYAQGLFQLIDYFTIAMQGSKYPHLSQEQIRIDLSNRFRDYGTRIQYQRIPTI
jgi:hypothetical protein